MMIVWYSQMPDAKKTSITNAYYNNYLAYDAGYDRLPEDSFKNASIAFSPKTSPSWSNVYDWSYPGLADASEFRTYTSNVSMVARVLYAENSDAVGGSESRKRAMRATADVIMNRARYTSYGGPTYTGVVLKSGAFSAMRDGNVGTSNPVFYSADLDAWSYALFIANHMYSDIEPWGANQELGTGYFHFYDITNANPFYIYSGGSYIQTTSTNVTSATHYKVGSTYYRITATPVKIGNVIFFSY